MTAPVRLSRTPVPLWNALACACALLSCTLLWLAPAALARPHKRGLSAEEHALTHSRALWATIDVCGPAGEPNTVGIRGSMPGDGRAADKMYMSFRLQYLSGTSWINVDTPGTGWVLVGAAGVTRQEGTSFALKPASGAQPYTLRGVIEFQWRRDGRVLVAASEPTSTGHKSVVENANPPGYSAATCAIS